MKTKMDKKLRQRRLLVEVIKYFTTRSMYYAMITNSFVMSRLTMLCRRYMSTVVDTMADYGQNATSHELHMIVLSLEFIGLYIFCDIHLDLRKTEVARGITFIWSTGTVRVNPLLVDTKEWYAFSP